MIDTLCLRFSFSVEPACMEIKHKDGIPCEAERLKTQILLCDTPEHMTMTRSGFQP